MISFTSSLGTVLDSDGASVVLQSCFTKTEFFRRLLIESDSLSLNASESEESEKVVPSPKRSDSLEYRKDRSCPEDLDTLVFSSSVIPGSAPHPLLLGLVDDASLESPAEGVSNDRLEA